MGNREDLLAGAKRCLYEKGYSRTTARDVATAAGTSLAAIGYHFRTTEVLLNAALHQAIEEWGEELAQALSGTDDPTGDASRRFEAIWTRVIATFERHRPLWSIQFEIAGHLADMPELRDYFADAQHQGRLALAELFAGINPVDDPESARIMGSLHQALLGGVMLQWLIDPDRAPSARDLTTALTRISADFRR